MSTRTTPTRTRTTRTRTTRTSTQTTQTCSAAALARAIEPRGRDEFVGEYWEKQPLHVGRGEVGRFDDLLSARDAERLICEPGLRYPAFRLVKAGERLDVRDYTADVAWRPTPFTGAAHVARVLAEFEAGATIVLQALHMNWLPLARFCRELEALLGHPVQANAYLTPRRSQGLPVHHDTHDVFVLQVSGSKRWLVYEPALELPLKHQRYRPEHGAPGEPILDLDLRPGDTLYLPRGWLHEALTSADDSLHLTIGVNLHTWVDALRAALARCEGEVAFRRSVALDGEGGDTLLDRLAEELGPETVAAAMRERFVRSRRAILDGQLSQLRALDGLAADTVVERRATVIADLDAAGDRIALAFEGKRVSFPVHAHDEVEALARSDGGVRIEDLPGQLDAESRLVLVRRLVREGFLRIVS